MPLTNSVDSIDSSINFDKSFLSQWDAQQDSLSFGILPDPPITSSVADSNSLVTFSSIALDAYGKGFLPYSTAVFSHEEDNLSFFDDLSPSISLPTQDHIQQSLPAEKLNCENTLLSTPQSGSTPSPASSQVIQPSRRQQQSLTPGSRENPVSVDRIEKRQRNNVAARKYRQKRIDRIEELEAALSSMTKERDDLRIKAARSDAEIQLLKDMLHIPK